MLGLALELGLHTLHVVVTVTKVYGIHVLVSASC